MQTRTRFQAITPQVLGLSTLVATLWGAASVVMAQPASDESNKLKAACISNMKQNALALLMYSTDCDDVLPPAKTWMGSCAPYCRDYGIYACPCVVSRQPRKVVHRGIDPGTATATGDYGYAFNSNLSMKHMMKFNSPAKLALTFESSNLKWNANDSGTSLLKKPRHPDAVVVSYLDGHVKASTVKDSTKVKFKP